MERNRVPQGIPTGGRFSTQVKSEPGTKLNVEVVDDAEGFPSIPCRRCAGSGNHHESGDYCLNCSGTGLVPASDKAKKAIANFDRAKRKASRPQAHDVEPGQTVSLIGKVPGRYQWGKVARVDVAKTRPMRFKIKDCERIATAWLTRVTMEDGTKHFVNSDTIMARRVDGLVDPEPFIRQARM